MDLRQGLSRLLDFFVAPPRPTPPPAAPPPRIPAPPPRPPQRFDPFTIDDANPLRVEHLLIREFLYQRQKGPVGMYFPDHYDTPAGQTILQTPAVQRTRYVWALLERQQACGDLAAQLRFSPQQRCYESDLRMLLTELLASGPEFSLSELRQLLERQLDPAMGIARLPGELLILLQKALDGQPVPPEIRSLLIRLRPTVYQSFPAGEVVILEQLIGSRFRGFMLPTDPCSAAILESLEAMPEDQQQHWVALLRHAQGATASKPSQRWLKTAAELLEPPGMAAFSAQMQRWLAASGENRREAVTEPGRTTLKGLVWMCSLIDDPALAEALAQAGLACLRRLSRWKYRAQKVGTACLLALAWMPGEHGIRCLLKMRPKVHATPRQEAVFKALNNAAIRRGVTLADLEEISLPTFGLDAGGRREDELDGYTAVLYINSPDDIRFDWRSPSGKTLANTPARARKNAPQALANLQSDHKALRSAIAEQCTRLEHLLVTHRAWSYEDWQARYLENPVLAALAHGLIWQFEQGGQITAGIPLDGQIIDALGRPFVEWGSESKVRLWHPAASDPAGVIAWREFLDTHRIRQPFPQARREIYLLSDAERATHTYSNRFAAHIVQTETLSECGKQRGWHAGAFRGWGTNRELHHYLPEMGLRAEFWLEQVQDIEAPNLHGETLSSDQVRFYQNDHAHPQAVPLEQVPPIYFSEIMRDVAHFIAECRVDHNPFWQDHAERPAPAMTDDQPWRQAVFGDLTASAEARKAALQQLLPGLKIARRCQVEGKYLLVKGRRRSYKIHLGSGNILMQPDDQYLCIVPGRDGAPTRNLFLPFQDDPTLSLILSKAFLLAEDDQISDPTITRQIEYMRY